jgi:hypothetical protein
VLELVLIGLFILGDIGGVRADRTVIFVAGISRRRYEK